MVKPRKRNTGLNLTAFDTKATSVLQCLVVLFYPEAMLAVLTQLFSSSLMKLFSSPCAHLMVVVVIENGVINYPSLEALEHDEEWLDKELNRLGQKLDEVFLAEVNEQKLWVYPDVKKAS
ncbi:MULTISPECIES: YetF domain-containing protein [Snodgrassella]|nr:MULTISPECIES: YetF domain-containing protein [Snodgrassella]